MTHDELVSEVADVVDNFEQIINYQKLIEMSIELTDSFSEKSFDRMALLLEVYNSGLNCYIDNMKVSLNRIQASLLNGCNSTIDVR